MAAQSFDNLRGTSAFKELERQISSKETIHFAGRPSFLAMVLPVIVKPIIFIIVFGLIFAAAAIVLVVLGMTSLLTGLGIFMWLILAALGLVFLIMLLATAISILKSIFSWKSTLYAATDKRGVYQYGVFSKMFKEVPYDQVTDTLVLRPFFQRIVGCGVIAFNTAGHSGAGYELTWTFVKNPVEVKQLVSDLVEDYKEHGSRGRGRGRDRDRDYDDRDRDRDDRRPPPPPSDDGGGPPSKFCGGCGGPLKPGNKFCEGCGKPQ